ncbi:permease-like cell division protein FtsX [Dechloromonas denitrificans]|uniref:permease-like cell division protein FtsX n=1 Tax=Azonexaceae TaxID=2008795 RepID=UPI001CF90015|nr:permease-like cell division protein FtsX [Dechloromonas denitrificans]UCV04224.1 permease-like cell division protein FtsX [Dechloromonas denitrificans]UCV08512.1 permease-like cell division protein FtsX [Dechloromonas denitrificans]
MNAWLSQHRAALASAFRRLWSTPLNTLLSLLVIGIALTLPGFGYVLLDNLRDLGRNASGVQQISLFMSLEASKKEVGEIESRLRAAADGKWQFIPKEQALKRMQKSEGMAEIVASLPRNPLPDAFIVEPSNSEPEALEILRKEIASWPKVEHVQLDSAWVKRFDAFLKLGRLALSMLAGIFAAGLIAVTFNTIRLQVMAQAAEIEVARMIGATDVFIRRPFYYFGALQGALGGLLAAALVLGALRLLAGPVSELAALYGGSFSLRTPGVGEIAALAGAGAFLGWLGAQLSVSLSLRKFD